MARCAASKGARSPLRGGLKSPTFSSLAGSLTHLTTIEVSSLEIYLCQVVLDGIVGQFGIGLHVHFQQEAGPISADRLRAQ